MSTPAIVMWAVVALIGVPSAWRNPTAAALVLCWIAGEVIFLLTGNNLPVEYYAYPDAFVIAVIFCKPAYCDLDPPNLLAEIKCTLLERSPCDRIILLSYPLVWTLYVIDISDYHKWWSLWIIAVAQFLVAAWEPLSKSLRRNADAVESQPDRPGDLLVACPAGGWGGP